LVNHVKRKSLKTLATAAAGTAVLSNAPLSMAGSVLGSDSASLTITHVETVFGQTVFIENLSEESVKLESLYPSRFATASGEFDMQSLLGDGALEIQPATTQAHNISDDGRVHNWAVWNTLETSDKSMVTEGRVRPVNVLVHDQSRASAPRATVYNGYFA